MNLEVNTTISYKHIDECPTRVCHLVGGSRSGKTFACIQWLIVQALQNKELVTIVRKTIPSLKRTVMRDFKEIMQSMGIFNENDFNQTDRTYTFFNDSQIQFISTDNAEKLRGVKSNILWIEEASEVDSESYLQLQIRTTGKIILSYNPTVSPWHWLREMNDCSRYFSTYKDNPYLERSVIRALEDLKNTNPKAYQVYTKGEYTTNDKAIFEFEQVEWLPDEAEFIAWGLDFGYANDPNALVSLWKMNGNELYILEHCYEKGMITGEIIEMLRAAVQGREEIWADSSEPRLIEEISRAGFNIRPVTKGKDSINFGIGVLQNYKIKIPKSCQNLVNEFYSYEWETDRFGKMLDKPVDFNNHLLDAARYVAMMRLSHSAANKGKYTITIR
jgi:phage terminase large subunit